jgi:hypothetical protein
VAATGNVNGASITAEPPMPPGGATDSFSAAPNSGQNDCGVRNREISFHRFHHFHHPHSRLHAHHHRLRVYRRYRTWASRRVPRRVQPLRSPYPYRDSVMVSASL